MNSVILCGRLTKDPEKRVTQTGLSVASFTLAVDRRKDANGNRVTDFFNCTAWRQTADFVCQYFTKGRKALVRGSLQNREYQAQDGTNRRVTEIVADEVEFADSKPEGAAQHQAQAPAQAQDDFDDDLPF